MSVRQRAVDLLYAMCDRTNAEEIVSEMLAYLETADYSIREEMVSFTCSNSYSCLGQTSKPKFFILFGILILFQVLKVAILAEKYAVDYTWYVDTILNLIRIAGDYVSEEVQFLVTFCKNI